MVLLLNLCTQIKTQIQGDPLGGEELEKFAFTY